MTQPVVIDYIVVGQGLAGSALALQMLQRGNRVLVIDQPAQNHASAVAAGLFNPVTGRNAVKTWLADRLFPYLHAFYADAEKLTGGKFFFSAPVYRPFTSVGEQNEWMSRSADGSVAPYIGDIKTSPAFGGRLHEPFGGLLLKQSGYVSTIDYLNAVRNFIASNAILQQSDFDEEKLLPDSAGVTYGDFRAKKIIFCQGEATRRNRWFKNLPIRPLKGEMLTIKTHWETDVIPNRGVYMVPGGVSGEFRVGSTYRASDFSPFITPEGRNEIETRLRDLICIPYEVSGQQWGIRPATPDRRPVLGRHPEFEHLIIFNGLGTKGVSLAPYFSGVLYRWLADDGSLDEDVDVTRFY